MTYATTILRNEIHRLEESRSSATEFDARHLCRNRIFELEKAIATLEARTNGAGAEQDCVNRLNEAFRVWRNAVNPPQQPKPDTFTELGLEWIRHVPGDPMPCHGGTVVRVMTEQDRADGEWCFGRCANARVFNWGCCPNPMGNILGWNLHNPA